MIITLIAISLFLISLVILIVSKIKTDDSWDDLFGRGMFTIIAGIFLLGVSIVILMNPIARRADMARFCSVQESLELSRPNPDVTPLELVAIQHKIIEKNEWLATSQFWARHKLTDWFWPKEILELRPIK
jgi:hypothetical protein